MLPGSQEHIAKAHRHRGGLRQAGYLAAAGLFALENHVARLRDDHTHVKAVAAELRSLPYVASVLPVETNIVSFFLMESMPADAFEIRTFIAVRGATEGCTGELWFCAPIPIVAVGCTVAVMQLPQR